MTKIILILILFSISTVAKASDWKYMGATVDADFYIDAESVLVEGDRRTYWGYTKLKEPRVLGDKIVYTIK